MNLNVETWKEYKVKDLFTVKYGINLELNACEETTKEDPNGVAFVARTSENNGVTAYVKRIKGKKPQPAETITVAGGGSVLSTFVQLKPFYSGRDLYLLYPKYEEMNLFVKLFIVTLLRANQYRYSYGRQANKTLPDIVLRIPTTEDGTPDWQFMEDYIKSLHCKPITTKNNKTSSLSFDTSEWKTFKVTDVFSCTTTKLSIKDDLDEGITPFVSRTAENNGIDGKVDVFRDKVTSGNCITIGAEGIYAFYQPDDFATGNKIYQLRNPNLNKYNALFVCTVLNKEDYRYSYGRARVLNKLKEEELRLPVREDGNPDWDFMENYIKSLPYGDRI